jgi:hypothetical protein
MTVRFVIATLLLLSGLQYTKQWLVLPRSRNAGNLLDSSFSVVVLGVARLMAHMIADFFHHRHHHSPSAR